MNSRQAMVREVVVSLVWGVIAQLATKEVIVAWTLVEMRIVGML